MPGSSAWEALKAVWKAVRPVKSRCKAARQADPDGPDNAYKCPSCPLRSGALHQMAPNAALAKVLVPWMVGCAGYWMW